MADVYSGIELRFKGLCLVSKISGLVINQSDLFPNYKHALLWVSEELRVLGRRWGNVSRQG